MTEPTTPPHLIPHMVPHITGGGYKWMPPIEDSDGDKVQVYESSYGPSPHVWLAVNNADNADTVHLNLDQVEQLRDQLGWLAEQHYQKEGLPVKRTRKELKVEVRRLRAELTAERQKFAAVNDRCGKTIRAINEARDVLANWSRGTTSFTGQATITGGRDGNGGIPEETRP